MIVSTHAIVLHRMKYKNSSLIARIFSENSGKISIIMNGAGKRKENYVGILEPPNIIKIDYYQRETKSLQTCKEVNFSYKTSNIRNDITRLSVSLAIVEIIDKTFHENDCHPNAYQLTNNVLQLVDNTLYNPKLILIFFLIKLISELGFKIDFEDSKKEFIQNNQETNSFLLNLNQCTLNDLMDINCANINLIEIIMALETYIKQHLTLNKNIESLKMIREITYE